MEKTGGLDLVGQTLGPFQIIEPIGKGGMAIVFKAYQPSMDRHVAIKVLPAHFMQDDTFVERFEREARTIARLEHPHILPVYDYGKTDDGTTYIAMRYIETGTLADLLTESVLFLEESFRIMQQIAGALDYAHRQGVIHRDLKPSNVLLDLQGEAFLSDFGLARLVTSEGSLTGGMVVGTPAYMAPEQGEGQPADERSDIYALGVIFYEMVTGRRPFQAETPMAMMLKHITEPLPAPCSVNPELSSPIEQVLLRTLEKDPTQRYQSVAEMQMALDKAIKISTRGQVPGEVAGQPIDHRPAPSTQVISRSSPPHWSVIGLVALVLILILLLIFWLFP